MATEERSPFLSVTPESLKAEMLARVNAAGADVDTREGSYANILLSEAAYEMWKYGQTLNGLLDILFPGPESGDYLDMHAAQIGMTRRGGTKARAAVTFTGIDGTEIPAGTIVCTRDARRFRVLEAAVISDGAVYEVECEAEEAGAAGNVPAGTITQMAVNVPGVTMLTNETAGTGGADEESDADLWARYHERRAKPISAGNANHYEMWAKETPGVSFARCVPLWNGNGTVKVIVAGTEREALDEDIVSACAAHIEEERPIGAAVTVTTVETLEISLSAEVTLEEGYTAALVQAELSEAAAAMLAALPFAAAQTVPYSRFLACLLQCAGVADYAECDVNGAPEAVEIPLGSVPVLKTAAVRA